jgi:uncharacterized membrane protein HdeD (DUF308 family)
MEKISNGLVATARYRWGLMIIGLLLIMAGISVFLSPTKTYLILNFIFSAVIVISGFSKIFITSATGNKKDKGGWTVTAGIFEILTGIFFLIFSLASRITLPFVLGFWIMFRAVYMMGTAIDLKRIKISGWGWILAGSIGDLVLTFLVFYNPARAMIGIPFISAVVFIAGGVFNLVLALMIKNIKTTGQKQKEEYMPNN